ncbi:hypothetical protein JCM33374_g5565 [Metschnikowia sp. JCM 33374]|nr:hypothetical protein JCM33374_g5565 [Metschnikowia sp. JCM 33374]
MEYDRLIILPCHSIWKGQDTQHSQGQNSSEWFLASFQVEGQDHLCFIDHIKRSFEELKKSPRALLVISGGQTKSEAGPVSEALSYYQLARRILAGPEFNALFDRVVLEEYARDSLENVLFSVCRFYEITASYPEFITVVGFEFKRTRFLKYHLVEALNFPDSRVEYIGNSPTPGSDIDHEHYFSSLEASEQKHALEHFETDLYGIRNPPGEKGTERPIQEASRV